MSMVRDILKIPELRRRFLRTLGLLCIFRLGFFIYLPGIDIAAFLEAQETAGDSALDWLLLTGFFTAGSPSSPVLFALGLMPYLLASTSIPGIERGHSTASHLAAIIRRITSAGAAFLAFIALALEVVTRALDLDPYVSQYLTGAVVLIVAGVALDLKESAVPIVVIRPPG